MITDISNLTAFFGWCSVINIGFLFFITIFIVVAKDFAMNMHGKLFGVPEEKLKVIYFRYIAYYKLLTFITCLVPYISLKLM